MQNEIIGKVLTEFICYPSMNCQQQSFPQEEIKTSEYRFVFCILCITLHPFIFNSSKNCVFNARNVFSVDFDLFESSIIAEAN